MQKDDSRAIGYLTQALRLFPGDDRARAALVNYKINVDELVPSHRLTGSDVKPYLGAYRSDDDQLEVEYKNGTLLAHNPTQNCELRFLTQNRFYCMGNDINLEFNRGARGEVSGLRVELPDHDEKYRRGK
jgi:hypothetical protein